MRKKVIYATNIYLGDMQQNGTFRYGIIGIKKGVIPPLFLLLLPIKHSFKDGSVTGFLIFVNNLHL